MLVIFRQKIYTFKTGYAERLIVAFQSVLCENIVLTFANEKTDGRIVAVSFKKVVYTRYISAQLAQKGRFKF